MDYLTESRTYSHLVNSNLWKNSKSDTTGITIPIFLYLDDFEINDPLGSKSGQQKICGIYYSFPSLPQFQLSKLSNIFLAGFVKARDLQDCGFTVCFTPLLNILKNLETNGLQINTDGNSCIIHFKLAQILGDNLGLNSALGYVSSFSANSWCRICRRQKHQTRTDCIEVPSSFRNKHSYSSDVLTNNPVVTGIKNVSIFNSLPNFHVTDNIVCDIMHDLFLGVCKYNFSKILYYFIYERKIFCLETFNYRKQMFQYGDTEIGNISPPIQKHHIQNSSFKMNARQMIGDLIDPEDLVYKFLILFVKMIDLLLLSNYSDIILNDLQVLIEQHNSTYQKLFKEHLKPKFHNLVHYPTIIKKLGPLKFLWTFRFEAEHQLHKQYAQSITSRTNVPLTLAIKSLRFSHCVLANNFFQPEYSFAKTEEISLEIKEHLSSTSLDLSLYKKTNEIVFRGVTFKIGHVVTLTMNEDVNIYEVVSFIIKEDSNVEIVGKKWKHICFSERFQSYLVGPVSEIYDIINFKTLDGPPVHFYWLNNGLKVLRKKKYW